jgi:hypothetical protein
MQLVHSAGELTRVLKNRRKLVCCLSQFEPQNSLWLSWLQLCLGSGHELCCDLLSVCAVCAVGC